MSEPSYAESLRQHYSEVRRRLGLSAAPVPVIMPIEQQVEIAKEALPPVEPPVVRITLPNGPVAVREIIAATALASGLSFEEIRGPRRTPELVGWRQAAMYLAVVLRPDMSFPSIGKVFKRNHSTVMYGFEKVSDNFKKHEYLVVAILDRLTDDPEG